MHTVPHGCARLCVLSLFLFTFSKVWYRIIFLVAKPLDIKEEDASTQDRYDRYIKQIVDILSKIL